MKSFKHRLKPFLHGFIIFVRIVALLHLGVGTAFIASTPQSALAAGTANTTSNVVYSTDGGGTWVDNLSGVATGTSIYVRLWYGNTTTTLTGGKVGYTIPTGFTRTANSTINCLQPLSTNPLSPNSVEQVCNTDAGQGGALTEGTIWAGQVLGVSPSAGLYGVATNATTGQLVMGKKRYFNLQDCQYNNTGIADHIDTLVPTGVAGFNANSNMSNAAATALSCGAGGNAAGGSFTFVPALSGFQAFDMLGKRYINFHECRWRNSAGGSHVETLSTVIPNIATAGFRGRTDVSNTSNSSNGSCGAGGTTTGGVYSPYTHPISTDAPYDMVANRYLNLHDCDYYWTGTVSPDNSGGPDAFLGNLYDDGNPGIRSGSNASNTANGSISCGPGGGGYNPDYTQSGLLVFDGLDTARSAGFIQFQMTAPTANGGSFSPGSSLASSQGTATDTSTILVVPPAPVVNNQPATSGSPTTISGTAEPGSTVKVYEGGTLLCTVTATGGTWSCSTPLTDGTHTITATTTDAGGTSTASGSKTYNVDATAPVAPVITAPTSGSSTNNNKPPITGTAEGGSTVKIYADGNTTTPICTTTATAGGTYTCTPGTALSDGAHTINATATDAVGNVSPASPNTAFTVDTSVPAAPVITAPTSGSTTNNNKPPITGTAEGGSTVKIYADGNTTTPICTTTATAGGTYTCTPGTALNDGAHTINATATDTAGNVSPASPNTAFTVDTSAPAAPVITAPTSGSTTNNNKPAITGTAEGGSTVKIYADGNTTTPICTTTATAGGTYTCTPGTALNDGAHTINATATDTAGNVSPASADTSFTVNTGASAAPVITTPASGSSTNNNTPAITGTAEAGSTVKIYADGNTTTPICTTTADATTGAYSCTPTTALGDGAHTINATATNTAGTVSPASADTTFTVDTSAPAKPIITGPASGSTVLVAQPTITGKAEPGSMVKVYDTDGTTVLCTATTDANGDWTCVSTPLTTGPHTITAKATDAAGNTSPASDPITITVNASADLQITINSPSISVGGTGTQVITVKNNGPSVAAGPIHVSYTPPTGVTIDSLPANCTGALSGPIDCTIPGPMASGDSVAINVMLKVPSSTAAGAFSGGSTAITSGAINDNDTSNNGPIPATGSFVTGSGDSDGDGIPDRVECPNPAVCPDTDGDGIPNYLDTDSDGDGIPDKTECPDPTACTDTDGDTVPDYLEPNNRDTDGDGLPDFKDADDDGDGIPTRDEHPGGGLTPRDTDGDGIPDYLDKDSSNAPGGNGGDSDGDGIPDIVECPHGVPCPDTDGDGIPNYMDLDSDGDGIPDLIECPNPAACTDTDKDTVPDYLEPNNADTDGDGIPNNLDADDDGDGIPTKDENPGGGLYPRDTDKDGVPDYLDKDGNSTRTDGGDSDGDGIPDKAECPNGVPCPDTDGDGVPNYMDTDSDGDGVLDKDECPDATACKDSDGDSVPDYLEPNNGDTDGDGIPNYLDTDDDGDGIPTKDEQPGGGLTPVDTDLDGIPDYLDANNTDPGNYYLPIIRGNMND